MKKNLYFFFILMTILVADSYATWSHDKLSTNEYQENVIFKESAELSSYIGSEDLRTRHSEEICRFESKKEPGSNYCTNVMLSQLEPFGYDLFDEPPSTFAPVEDIPVPANYIIGPGDVVQVQLLGKESDVFDLQVDREGYLHFPGLGPISVAGLEYDAMRKMLGEQVSEQMIGIKVSVTLGPLRSMRVFVLGDVSCPGSYTLSSLSSISHALFAAGGVDYTGSLRNIQLKRQGEVVAQLDLYDMLLFGDTSGDLRLRSGDVVFVPPVGVTVAITGDILRPAIYELKENNKLEELLNYAGGTLPTAYLPDSTIQRINDAGQLEVLDVNLGTEEGLMTLLLDGDEIFVESGVDVYDDSITVLGHVKRPGVYGVEEGDRLLDVLSFDKLSPRADLHYCIIRRLILPGKKVQLFAVSIEDAMKEAGGDANVLIESGDTLFVFEVGDKQTRYETVQDLIEELKQQNSNNNYLPVVEIHGAISVAGGYPFYKGMRVVDLVRAGGMLIEGAYTLEAELTRYTLSQNQGVQVSHFKINLDRALAGNDYDNLLLEPRDHLFVKMVPEWGGVETVDVVGEVRFPGTYCLKKGEALLDLVNRAGGLTEAAYPAGAVFLRESLKQKEKDYLDRMAAQLEGDIAAQMLKKGFSGEKTNLGSDASSSEFLESLLAQIRNAEPLGRLVIDLPRTLAKRDWGNFPLEKGDRLFIPKKPIEVSVVGEIQFPTAHIHDADMRKTDYINASGGLTYKADKKRIYIVRAGGAVAFSRGRSGPEIQPGDTIVVPLKVDHVNQLALWTNVTQILYNTAIAAATVNRI